MFKQTQLSSLGLVVLGLAFSAVLSPASVRAQDKPKESSDYVTIPKADYQKFMKLVEDQKKQLAVTRKEAELLRMGLKEAAQQAQKARKQAEEQKQRAEAALEWAQHALYLQQLEKASKLYRGQPEEVKKTKKDSHFTDKIVFVQAQKDVATLKNARIENMGGREFLVGQIVDDKVLTKGHFTGATLCVPLGNVERLVVFDSLKQLQQQ